MAETLKIKIVNNLLTEKRTLNVYHHAKGSAHLIGHAGSVTLSLKSGTGDYLYVSVVKVPGNTGRTSVIDIPPCIDFHFTRSGDMTLARRGEIISLHIPPGVPAWELKITIPDRTDRSSLPRNGKVTVYEREQKLTR